MTAEEILKRIKPPESGEVDFNLVVAAFEAAIITRAMRDSKSRAATARLLRMNEATLAAKIVKYGLKSSSTRIVERNEKGQFL